jgi:hypothetical protein
VLVDAAEDDGGAGQERAVGGEALADLRGQLAGGREYQAPDRPGPLPGSPASASR